MKPEFSDAVAVLAVVCALVGLCTIIYYGIQGGLSLVGYFDRVERLERKVEDLERPWLRGSVWAAGVEDPCYGNDKSREKRK